MKPRSIRILSANLRGAKSKLSSIKEVICELKPDILALQETHLKEKEKILIEGYKWIEGNRNKQSGGGVGFLVDQAIIKNVIREPTTNYIDKMEVRWIRLVVAESHHVCIGVYYGKQESYSHDNTQDEYDALQDQILAYQMNGDEVILLGDFNAKVGHDAAGIQDGDPNCSRNGKMLIDLIENLH